MYKSVAAESKKNPGTKLIKGHTHGIPLPVGYQPPTIQQNWTERAAISPFQPILPAQVSSSQNLLEPPLIIGELLLEPPLIIGELLPESPLIIGPTGRPITNPTVLQSYSATSWFPHQLVHLPAPLSNIGQTHSWLFGDRNPARSTYVHWYLPMKDLWNCDTFLWNTFVNIIA